MTTLQQIELCCPVCATRFRSQAVVATNAFGGRRTDFHERAAGTQPLAYLVHMCNRCGYAGSEGDFADDTDVSAALKARVWSELAPALGCLSRSGGGSSVVPGWAKYEAAAKVEIWQGGDPRTIGDCYLRAAWCCVDEDDSEAERYFRRKAAWMFAEALASFDGVPGEERAVLTYLVGELWRRIGDVPAAERWFDKVAGEVASSSPAGAAAAQWVVKAARQQREAPKEWFG
jgi:uncharacterized protein (DUF2225 family)